MNNSEFYLVDAIEVIEEVLRTGGEFRMYPKGTSMLPLLEQGRDSVVLMKRMDPLSPVKKNEIAFYRRDGGQFVLHRVLKCRKDGSYVMCGDNQTQLEPDIRPDQIIGYVTKIYKKDKLLSLSSFRYRFYVWRWTFMPYRKSAQFVKICLRRMKQKLFGNK